MSDDIVAARIRHLEDEISWVNDRLHDSQEHAQIVRLEAKRERLWKELEAARGESHP